MPPCFSTATLKDGRQELKGIKNVGKMKKNNVGEMIYSLSGLGDKLLRKIN